MLEEREMSEAEEWREHIAELRQLAAQTPDDARRQRLFELADRWEGFAVELDGPLLSAASEARA